MLLLTTHIVHSSQKAVHFDVIAYFTVMYAFFRIGQFNKVLEIFEGMIEDGFEPDILIFELVIKAFVQMKDLDSATDFLETMEDLSLNEPMPGITHPSGGKAVLDRVKADASINTLDYFDDEPTLGKVEDLTPKGVYVFD